MQCPGLIGAMHLRVSRIKKYNVLAQGERDNFDDASPS